MYDYFKGVIIEESLEDKNFLRRFKILKTEIGKLETEAGKWHLHYVTINENKLDEISEQAKAAIKEGWYMHFWKENKMIVIFKGKKFKLLREDKRTIEEARNYGISIGIPKEQLEFEKLFTD